VTLVPLLLFALAGILAGGVVSLLRQGASRFSVVLVGLLAALAAASGVLWLIPGDGS
jgi:hypothetical protein